jgi:hypothetical protein
LLPASPQPSTARPWTPSASASHCESLMFSMMVGHARDLLSSLDNPSRTTDVVERGPSKKLPGKAEDYQHKPCCPGCTLGTVSLEWANTTSSEIRQLASNFPALKRAYSGIPHFANRWGSGRLKPIAGLDPSRNRLNLLTYATPFYNYKCNASSTNRNLGVITREFLADLGPRRSRWSVHHASHSERQKSRVASVVTAKAVTDCRGVIPITA